MTRLAQRRDALTIAAAVFLAANVIHGLDHVRQGIGDLNWEVLWGGSMLTLLAVLTLAIVVRGNPRAPLFAAFVGLWSGLGVVASHIAPHWSAFSDPYPAIHADALSWIVMLAEVGAAFALALVGLRLSLAASGRAAARRAGPSLARR